MKGTLYTLLIFAIKAKSGDVFKNKSKFNKRFEWLSAVGFNYQPGHKPFDLL